MGYFPVSPNNVMSDTPPLTSPSGICNQEQPFVDTNDLRVGSQEDMLEEKQQQPILPPKQLVRKRREREGRGGGERGRKGGREKEGEGRELGRREGKG